MYQKDSNSATCQNEEEIQIPEEIIDATIKGNLVIFAGAGISTETKDCFVNSFYTRICSELGIKSSESTSSFSEIMSKFYQKPNGKKLLWQKIRERIDYVNSFPELKNIATSFHRALAPLHLIDTIITTNWDNYFEEYCNALPIVSNEDLAFYDYPNTRKVFKIHGSISSPSSMVATKEEYDNCYKRLNEEALGSPLKMMLATKTILFCGFSFGDEDLKRIFSMVQDNMGGLMPHSYIITVDGEFNEKLYPNASIIKSDATAFLIKLRERLSKHGHINNPIIYDAIKYVLADCRNVHESLIQYFIKIKPVNPNVLYSLFYQDGFIHALERAENCVQSGKYLDMSYIYGVIESYKILSKKEKDKGKIIYYYNYAYIKGYLYGLSMFLNPDTLDTSYFYFIFGCKKKIDSFDEFKELAKKSYHKEAEETGRMFIKMSELMNNNKPPHHSPFL